MRDLSVLIPARNEEWLSRTVDDVCRNKRGDTEVIVVLDGEWPKPGVELAQHPDVQVIYLPSPIGQRAATNLAARVSESRYVMKLDAHCAMGEGFDVALLEAANELGPMVTQVPAQKHLHVFDQVCDGCGKRSDQSPLLKSCSACQGTSFSRVVTWEPRPSPTTTAWRFDADLHFQYWSGARGKQKGVKYPEIMSCLGACWFIDRERYWQIGGMDEDHGSWGAMGTELACKSWLSGGRMVVTKATWFAHFFRVGGHGFPYEMHGSDQEYARKYSQNLWRGNRWEGQIYPLRWLVERFWPVPGWSYSDLASLPVFLGVAGLSANTAGASPVLSDAVEGMAVAAGGASGLESAGTVSSQDIRCGADESQVSGIAAPRVTAHDVVDDERVSARGSGQGLDKPSEHDSVEPGLRARGVTIRESDAAVSKAVGVAGPQPAAGRSVDGNSGKDSTQGGAVDMRDREILGGSHASASIADVGSGPGSGVSAPSGPSILSHHLSAGIVYYSHGKGDASILNACRQQLARAAGELPIVSVTLQPLAFRQNVVLNAEPGILTMFRQILAGLEALDTRYAFLGEHDLLYAPEHFAFRPPSEDRYYYNTNVWHVDAKTGRAITYRAKRTSQLCANRELLIQHYRTRIARVEKEGFTRAMGFEPGSHGRKERVDDVRSDVWRSSVPNIDIRHSKNLTPSRWSPEQFRDQRNCQDWQEGDGVPGWGKTLGCFPCFLNKLGRVEEAVAV